MTRDDDPDPRHSPSVSGGLVVVLFGLALLVVVAVVGGGAFLMMRQARKAERAAMEETLIAREEAEQARAAVRQANERAEPSPAGVGESVTISRLGEYKLHGGRLVVRVQETDGEVRFAVHFVRPGGGVEANSKRATEKAAGWFVFPATDAEVWVYHGDDSLQLVEFKSKAGPMGEDVQSSTSVDPAGAAELLKRAPKEVLDRLPASFRVKPAGK